MWLVMVIIKYVSSCIQIVEPIYLKFETKISWVRTPHLNKNLHSEKSDQASLSGIIVFHVVVPSSKVKHHKILEKMLHFWHTNNQTYCTASFDIRKVTNRVGLVWCNYPLQSIDNPLINAYCYRWPAVVDC